MIKYNLKCSNNHEFESWFSNSNEFEKLNRKNLLECIHCNSKKIKKSIMAPMISGSKMKNEKDSLLKTGLSKNKRELLKIRAYVEKNFEFVGDKLSRKIREVYYDKKTAKGIYGTATKEEKEELADEGIELLSIPWVNKDN